MKNCTLLLIDQSGNVVLSRIVDHPRLEHHLDQVEFQLQDRTHPNLPIQAHTTRWFSLTAELVEEGVDATE